MDADEVNPAASSHPPYGIATTLFRIAHHGTTYLTDSPFTVSRMMSLKKAYADIILNTAKEAAARIMSSERKAMHFQHELQTTKDEALRMLCRIKQMMDSKVREAEVTSMNQRKKIEELESQLQEAEDIVRDLREDLREAQAELGRVNNLNTKHVNAPDNGRPVEASEENKVYQCQSCLLQTPFLYHNREAKKCCNETVCACNLYNGHPDLPSIILRSKERGLYKNGFTQRIRACSRDLTDKELNLSGKSVHKEYEEGKDITNGVETRSCLEKELLADIQLGSFKSSLRKKKRAIRCRKSITLSSKNCPNFSGKSDQVQEVCVRNDQNSVNYEDEGSMENIMLSRQETGTAESSLFQDCKTDNEKVDMVDGVPTQSTGERIFKYTFQRKRKRQPLSVAEVNVCLETDNSEREAGNKESDPLELESSTMTESSRDSRRLAQVARQLLSLSEKKWL